MTIICRENALEYLSPHIICSEERTVFYKRSQKKSTESFTDHAQGRISENIFAQNGDYCVYYASYIFRNKRSLSLGYSPVLAEAYSIT